MARYPDTYEVQFKSPFSNQFVTLQLCTARVIAANTAGALAGLLTGTVRVAMSYSGRGGNRTEYEYVGVVFRSTEEEVS
jgi:hypothetical protein